jgi:hypothetical protein
MLGWAVDQCSSECFLLSSGISRGDDHGNCEGTTKLDQETSSSLPGQVDGCDELLYTRKERTTVVYYFKLLANTDYM